MTIDPGRRDQEEQQRRQREEQARRQREELERQQREEQARRQKQRPHDAQEIQWDAAKNWADQVNYPEWNPQAYERHTSQAFHHTVSDAGEYAQALLDAAQNRRPVVMMFGRGSEPATRHVIDQQMKEARAAMQDGATFVFVDLDRVQPDSPLGRAGAGYIDRWTGAPFTMVMTLRPGDRHTPIVPETPFYHRRGPLDAHQLRQAVESGRRAMSGMQFAELPAGVRTERPGGEGQQRPGGEGQQRPGGEGQQRPGGEGQQRPGGEGQQRPGGEGQQRPGGEGQQRPGADGQQRPGADGQQRPGAEGQQRPGAEGQQRPGADGQQRPGADGQQRLPAGETLSISQRIQAERRIVNMLVEADREPDRQTAYNRYIEAIAAAGDLQHPMLKASAAAKLGIACFGWGHEEIGLAWLLKSGSEYPEQYRDGRFVQALFRSGIPAGIGDMYIREGTRDPDWWKQNPSEAVRQLLSARDGRAPDRAIQPGSPAPGDRQPPPVPSPQQRAERSPTRLPHMSEARSA